LLCGDGWVLDTECDVGLSGLNPLVALNQNGEGIVQPFAGVVNGGIEGVPRVVNPVVVEKVVRELIGG
jgi:hypothetical protein